MKKRSKYELLDYGILIAIFYGTNSSFMLKMHPKIQELLRLCDAPNNNVIDSRIRVLKKEDYIETKPYVGLVLKNPPWKEN